MSNEKYKSLSSTATRTSTETGRYMEWRMKLSTDLLKQVEAHEVSPGNIYPSKGGRKSHGTEYWLVVAVSSTGAHCIGFDALGNPCSATSYLKGAMRERPIVGKVDLSKITLETLT